MLGIYGLACYSLPISALNMSRLNELTVDFEGGGGGRGGGGVRSTGQLPVE